jgi:hypothetical protein
MYNKNGTDKKYNTQAIFAITQQVLMPGQRLTHNFHSRTSDEVQAIVNNNKSNGNKLPAYTKMGEIFHYTEISNYQRRIAARK